MTLPFLFIHPFADRAFVDSEMLAFGPGGGEASDQAFADDVFSKLKRLHNLEYYLNSPKGETANS